MSLVLLIDDEINPMQYYVRALKMEGFDVVQLTTADEALEYITNSRNRKPDIIVLDIMLPPGKYENNPDSDQGLRTGILLYPDLKELCVNIPFIVLTNVTNPETLRIGGSKFARTFG